MTSGTAPTRDWKLPTGYRVLLKVGWGTLALAVYFAAAGSIFHADVWWTVAGLATTGIVTTLLLPEPVPHDMINGRRDRAVAPAGAFRTGRARRR